MTASRVAAQIVVLLAAVSMLWPTAGGADGRRPDRRASAVRKLLQERLPEANIIDVSPSSVAGLYEVQTADGLLYADASGDHLLLGTLMDTRTRRNLTADAMDRRNAIDFRSLPFERAIKIVKGSGTRKLAVFADPDCPYCQKLEREMTAMSDVTVYVFLLPFEDLHPHAPARAHAIWCALDRAEAWRQWMLERQPPRAAACADDPVGELRTLARSLRIHSTPTLYLESGRRIGGALPLAELERAMADPPTVTQASARAVR